MTNEINYTIESNEDHKLTIIIGDGQIGYSTFKNIDNSYPSGEITDVLLEKGNELKGKTIYIDSMVTDVNPHTNLTSISFYINGSIINEAGPFKKEAENNNGSVFYITQINFI